PWSNVTGRTTGPNTYMQLTQPGGAFSLAVDGTCNLKPVLSQTYVHLWDKAYDLEGADHGTPTSTGSYCNSTNEPVTKAFDNLMTSSNGTKWCVTSKPSTSAPVSMMYAFPG